MYCLCGYTFDFCGRCSDAQTRTTSRGLESNKGLAVLQRPYCHENKLALMKKNRQHSGAKDGNSTRSKSASVVLPLHNVSLSGKTLKQTM